MLAARSTTQHEVSYLPPLNQGSHLPHFGVGLALGRACMALEILALLASACQPRYASACPQPRNPLIEQTTDT